ncbi:hypothetical protein BIW11_09113, partial [Tropilaelaps mercedesae]
SSESLSRQPQKGFRLEAAEEDAGSYLVEPDSVVAELIEKDNLSDSETVVHEKDVLHINADDELLRPKEIHKFGGGPLAVFYTAELTPDEDSPQATNVTTENSASSKAKPTYSETLPSSTEAPTTTTSARNSTPPVVSSAPGAYAMEEQRQSSAPSNDKGVSAGVTTPPASATSEATQASSTSTSAPTSSSTATEGSGGVEEDAGLTKLASATEGSTAPPIKVSTPGPSTVQKIPQFIKQIYEAAAHRLPSFIHAGSSETSLPASTTQTTTATPVRSERPIADVTFALGDREEAGVQSSGGQPSSPQPPAGEEDRPNASEASPSGAEVAAAARQFGVEVCLFQRLCLQSPGYKDKGDNGIDRGTSVPKGTAVKDDAGTLGIVQFVDPDRLGPDEDDDDDDDDKKDEGANDESPKRVASAQTKPHADPANAEIVQVAGGGQDKTKKSSTNRLDPPASNFLSTLTRPTSSADFIDQDPRVRPAIALPSAVPLGLNGPGQVPGHVPLTRPLHSPFQGWSQQEIALMRHIVRLDELLVQQESASATAAPTTAAPTASGEVSSTSSDLPSTSQKPMLIQSTTSSPEDSPIGMLVRGRACEGQSANRLDRIIDHFPARLPELYEFKRRRFLRAAVIGGLHTLKSTQRNVTCNLTSGQTHWGYRLRGQLDGILNLGITGLPRMYLRYTGPILVKVKLSALGSEDRPVVDQVTVEEAQVDEIHYQSVLGFEQPFVERATKYLLQRAMREEVVTPIADAIHDELANPKADKSKVLILEDSLHHL